MIAALRALFEQPQDESAEEQQHRLNMAAAALLIETARADFTQDAIEQAALEALLIETLQLTQSEVRLLVEAAEEKVDEATSLYQFTRILNDHYSATQKINLIGAMWKVAYADGDLDKYEEHLIRQVAELIYVSHADYIRCKLAAAN